MASVAARCHGTLTGVSEVSAYERMGGHETFVTLVDAFYARVAADPELRALYPEQDLRPAADRLRMFLEQYWGGPTTYSRQRGHPRLRMRHAPFAVTPTMRDHWLTHMRAAMDQVTMPEAEAAALWAYFEHAANFMINAPEPDRPLRD